MNFGRRERTRFIVVIGILGILGLASTFYLLREQRFPNPLRDTYTVKAEFTEADGVVAGLGQPVNVSGVKVGTIVEADHNAEGRCGRHPRDPQERAARGCAPTRPSRSSRSPR